MTVGQGVAVPFHEHLADLHRRMPEELSALKRVAVAIHDPDSDMLRTFADSNAGTGSLGRHQARLSDLPSLKAMVASGKPRIIDDLTVYENSGRHHNQWLLEQGFLSSYTVPVSSLGRFFCFVFYDAVEQAFFTDIRRRYLDIHAQAIGMLAAQEVNAARTMRSVFQAVRDMTNLRDNETGAHLERMARYSRLIAENLPKRFGFNDTSIEYLFQAAPLHDVGKIGTPDSILRKNGALDDDEWAQMRRHVEDGGAVVESILRNLGVTEAEHSHILRNVVLYHHEKLDGSGYPFGLSGDDIPIEARVTAVADVFDALCSTRPYKDAWPIEQAFDLLRKEAGTAFEPACVEALVNNSDAVREIQGAFGEDPLG